MARYDTTPNPVARVGVADVHCSAAIDRREDSANRPTRQVRTPKLSIPSPDGDGSAALARRGRHGHGGAPAAARGIGGAP